MSIAQIEATMEMIKDLEQSEDSTAKVWGHFTTSAPYSETGLVTLTGLPASAVAAAIQFLLVAGLIRSINRGAGNMFQLTPIAFLAIHPPK